MRVLLFHEFLDARLRRMDLSRVVGFAVRRAISVKYLRVNAVIFCAAVVRRVTASLKAPFSLFLSNFRLYLLFRAVLRFLVMRS